MKKLLHNIIFYTLLLTSKSCGVARTDDFYYFVMAFNTEVYLPAID